MTTIRTVLRDERGAETVQWIGLSAVILTLIMTIWLALYGGAGQALKATIGDVAAHYAAGFEGRVRTNGPAGGVPELGQPDPVVFDPPASPPTDLGVVPQGPIPSAPTDLGVVPQGSIPSAPTDLGVIPQGSIIVTMPIVGIPLLLE
jgi:hypothetical protein